MLHDVSVEDNAAQRASLKDMLVDELSEFLATELDIPSVYCEVLEGNSNHRYFWHVSAMQAFLYFNMQDIDDYVDGQALLILPSPKVILPRRIHTHTFSVSDTTQICLMGTSSN